ncbi:MAG: hypothetical protein JSS09_07275, partial [Verrucomicrobia bacterium]|nr:hypothetical protein [Verrucomicrobiota bacterium]
MTFLFNRLRLWWGKNPTRGKICLILTTLHISGLIWMIHGQEPNSPKKNQKILVRTIKASSPSKTFSKVAAPPLQEKKTPSSTSHKTPPIAKP